ncbi:hypothetical protein RRG08_050246 [Elysia crispata]|uniref:Uncharacterized protein n=1 Tax=Elysia crispata TaxID=231223 RepID=A0AAE1B594_9GAST|nr:hypothetical protein RRG08_050246 [Elysia crispata]
MVRISPSAVRVSLDRSEEKDMVEKALNISTERTLSSSAPTSIITKGQSNQCPPQNSSIFGRRSYDTGSKASKHRALSINVCLDDTVEREGTYRTPAGEPGREGEGLVETLGTKVGHFDPRLLASVVMTS